MHINQNTRQGVSSRSNGTRWPGSKIGVEKVLTAKEERVRSMKEQEIRRLHG